MNILYLLFSLVGDIHEGCLSLKHDDDEQSDFAATSKNLDKGPKKQ